MLKTVVLLSFFVVNRVTSFSVLFDTYQTNKYEIDFLLQYKRFYLINLLSPE